MTEEGDDDRTKGNRGKVEVTMREEGTMTEEGDDDRARGDGDRGGGR